MTATRRQSRGMGRGRTRKAGKRTKTGRLSRAGQPAFDQGTERTQAMTERYGQDGADAIGRAYRLGLLGKDSEAKAMLDTARRISKTYWRTYEVGRIGCTLGGRNHGSSGIVDHDKIKDQERWLNDCLAIARRSGAQAERAFHELVIAPYPDSGPSWLERQCQQTMNAALGVLSKLAA